MRRKKIEKLLNQGDTKTLKIRDDGGNTFSLDEWNDKGKKIYFIFKDEPLITYGFDYERIELIFNKKGRSVK